MPPLKAHEHNILEKALEAFKREVGLNLFAEQAEARHEGRMIDAVLRLGDRNQCFAAVVKRWIK